VAFAKRHNVLVLSDLAYAEVYFDDPPPSMLQVPGAMDVAVEFTSMSKTYSMPAGASDLRSATSASSQRWRA
jgi:alanine-synthesizing transaminase